MTTLRVFTTKSARYDLLLRDLGVSTARPARRTSVHKTTEQPALWLHEEVWELFKLVYGLKQAPRA